MATKNGTPRVKEQASQLSKPAVEARTVVTDHSTPPGLRTPVQISTKRRLQLACSAAFEIDELIEHMIKLQEGKMTEDSSGELVAMNAFLERMKLVTDALMDVATPEEDERQDAVAIERILHFAPEPEPENS